MKRILALVFVLFSTAFYVNAQTNKIESTGNVGIGTTTPFGNTILDVRGNIGYGVNYTESYIKPSSNIWGGVIKLRVDGSTVNRYVQIGYQNNSGVYGSIVHFDAHTQNVGIGTTSPLATREVGSKGTKLHVHNNKTSGNRQELAKFEAQGDADNVSALVRINHTNDRGLFLEGGRAISDRSFGKIGVIQTDGTLTDAMYFDDAANIGIGTTSPSEKLDVFGNANIGSNSSGDYLQIGKNFYASNNTTQLSPALYLYKSSSVGYGMKLHFDGLQYGTAIFGPNQANRFISFNKISSTTSPTSDSDFGTEYMRIDLDNGNIGIGTASPTDKLNVIKTGAGKIAAFGSSTSDRITFYQEGDNTARSIYNYNGSTFGVLKLGNYEDSKTLAIDGNTGQVRIGAKTPTGDYKLAVDGTGYFGEVIIEDVTSWSDFVFAKDYELKTLNEVENFITANKHLPDVPSEQEVKEKGFSLAEMDATLLQKIEELTLYTIEQQKEIEELKKENSELKLLKGELENIKELINQLNN